MKLQNITTLQVLNTIYTRKESVNYKYKYIFYFLNDFFNEKDGFGGHWGDHEC